MAYLILGNDNTDVNLGNLERERDMNESRETIRWYVLAMGLMVVGLVAGIQVGEDRAKTPAPIPVVGSGVKTAQRASENLGTWRVTAYCTCSKCCGEFSDGITASGKKAIGKIVAAPKSIPFGTLLSIPGYGVAPVEDRGGAIKGRKLDLLFPSHQAALNWGVKHIEVLRIN